MEFSKEFIEEQKFTPEQVTAITSNVTTHYDSHIADLKGGWDKKANDNAEGILDGVVKYTQSQNNFQLEREKGEKHGDYLNRFASEFLKGKSSALETSKTEYDEKIKGFKGSETVTKEYEDLKLKFGELQKKEADMDKLISDDLPNKYKTLTESYDLMERKTAFSSAKPNFPDTVNQYEANAKWESFQKKTMETWTPKLVDGEWTLINKENQHKQVKLSDEVGKDAELVELAKGRQQKGPNVNQVNLKKLEGIPFEVPETAIKDTAERSKLIKDHLLSTHPELSVTSQEFSTKFRELHDKIRGGVAAA